FLTLLRAPISTLFPYTTLFRSFGELLARDDSGWHFRGSGTHRPLIYPPIFLAFPPSGCTSGISSLIVDVRNLKGVNACFVQGWVDRKSTRLNSSHLGISYAVFC